MTTAIYARKSTDQSGVSDEQKSVVRQIEHARAFATRNGWTVADEHVYVDDGVSGAEFSNRPGFLRLMNALKPRAPFQVLVMSEESRLGRENIETGFALKQLIQAGVRVFFYLEDRERTLDSPIEKIMMQLTAFADELEREKARLRTHDALRRKAAAGHVTGGRVFGYDNVEFVGPDGQRSHVERRINEAEATVVRDIFALCRDGFGMKRIAHTLNGAGRACPRAQRDRLHGWAPSSVREVLYRDLYRGIILWNRTRKRDSWGQHHQRARPEGDWMRVAAPELQLIDDTLWTAAHARLEASRQTYARVGGGQWFGRPPTGVAAKYLLTGLTRCGACGASLMVKSRSHGRKRSYRYACSAYHLKGTSVCTNKHELPLDGFDQAILETAAELLTPAVVDTVLADSLAGLAASRPQDLRAPLEQDLASIDVEIGRLTAAIAAGGTLPALVSALQDRDRRRTALTREIATLSGLERATHADRTSVEADVHAKLADWRAVLGRQVAWSRQLLQKVLADRITCTPTTLDSGEPGYDVVASFTFGRFFEGILCPKGMASPTGNDTLWTVTRRRRMRAA